jgi:hypothetical protein
MNVKVEYRIALKQIKSMHPIIGEDQALLITTIGDIYLDSIDKSLIKLLDAAYTKAVGRPPVNTKKVALDSIIQKNRLL